MLFIIPEPARRERLPAFPSVRSLRTRASFRSTIQKYIFATPPGDSLSARPIAAVALLPRPSQLIDFAVQLPLNDAKVVSLSLALLCRVDKKRLHTIPRRDGLLLVSMHSGPVPKPALVQCQ